MMAAMNETVDLQDMGEAQLRQMLQRLMGEVKHKQALLDKLTYEMAVLKRLKFAAKAEALHADQRSLLDEALEEDLQAVAEEVEQMQPPKQRPQRAKAKRLPLPAQLPRQEFAHEPEATECCGQPMKRIGEDVAEKLDYTPGVFTVHKHVRGKWACACCQTLKQAPVDAHIIDKGIPTTGLLAHVLVAKYADHLPLYRQETMAAPLLIAKGAGEMAEQMKAMARRHRVPIVENRTLARALFAGAAVDQKIPDAFFAPVARLLVWVYAMRDRSASREQAA